MLSNADSDVHTMIKKGRQWVLLSVFLMSDFLRNVFVLQNGFIRACGALGKNVLKNIDRCSNSFNF